MFICKGPCKKELPVTSFGEFYQAGRLFRQSRCSDCRRNIPADYEATLKMFRRVFPKDNQKRSWRRMAERLLAKGFRFNKRAKEKWLYAHGQDVTKQESTNLPEAVTSLGQYSAENILMS